MVLPHIVSDEILMVSEVLDDYHSVTAAMTYIDKPTNKNTPGSGSHMKC